MIRTHKIVGFVEFGQHLLDFGGADAVFRRHVHAACPFLDRVAELPPVHLTVVGRDKGLAPAAANVIQAVGKLVVLGRLVIIEEENPVLLAVCHVGIEMDFPALDVKHRLGFGRKSLGHAPAGEFRAVHCDFQLGVIGQDFGEIGRNRVDELLAEIAVALVVLKAHRAVTEIIVAVVGDVGVAVDLMNAGEDIPQTFRQFKAGLAAIFADDELTDPLPVADGECLFHELAAHVVVIEKSRRAEHGEFHQHFAHVLELVDHAKDIRAAGHEPQTAVFVRDEGGELVKILPAPVILIVFCDFQQPLLRLQWLDILHKAAVLTAIAGVLEFHELSFSARRTGCHFHYLLKNMKY